MVPGGIPGTSVKARKKIAKIREESGKLPSTEKISNQLKLTRRQVGQLLREYKEVEEDGV